MTQQPSNDRCAPRRFPIPRFGLRPFFVAILLIGCGAGLIGKRLYYLRQRAALEPTMREQYRAVDTYFDNLRKSTSFRQQFSSMAIGSRRCSGHSGSDDWQYREEVRVSTASDKSTPLLVDLGFSGEVRGTELQPIVIADFQAPANKFVLQDLREIFTAKKWEFRVVKSEKASSRTWQDRFVP